jgi:hypothetical protein
MNISGVSDSGLAALSSMISSTKAQDQAATKVLKLANDQIRQEGADALKLIESTPVGSLGHNLDVRA